MSKGWICWIIGHKQPELPYPEAGKPVATYRRCQRCGSGENIAFDELPTVRRGLFRDRSRRSREEEESRYNYPH